MSTDALINISGILMITSILILALANIQDKAMERVRASILEWKASQSLLLTEAYLLGDNLYADLSPPCMITPEQVVCVDRNITIIKKGKYEAKKHL
ncbi:MAG: hypothetical protein ACTSVF_03620 [Candidatus Asgardarchaeia archaeon]